MLLKTWFGNAYSPIPYESGPLKKLFQTENLTFPTDKLDNSTTSDLQEGKQQLQLVVTAIFFFFPLIFWQLENSVSFLINLNWI